MLRKVLATTLAFGAFALGGGVGTANAAGQDAVKNDEEFIFFYNSTYEGSLSDFTGQKSNLAGFNFIRGGLAGFGEPVKNNSASVANFKTQGARIYFNSGFAGVSDYVGPDVGRNLTNTYNENASFKWV